MFTIGNGSSGVSVVCTLGACTGGRRKRTNFGGVIQLGSCVRHGLRIFVDALLQRGVPGTIVAHSYKTSRMALIARSCASHISVGACSSAQVRICRPWRTRSSGVRVGWVR